MKILVVSDSHRHDGNLKTVIEKTAPFDMLIHCGDIEGSEQMIREWAGCPVHMVSGNNDYFSDLPREEEFEIAGYHAFLTHGHYYYVSFGIDQLVEEAKDRGAQMVFYGHTHRPLLEEVDGITICNPGSISFPRQDGRRPSYATIDIDREGKAHFTINYLGETWKNIWY